ncbi:MAG: sulfotransferase domain-containing protein [Bryobacteraceae bacterium]
MLLFCDGMPRSASTWVYNVAFALLKNVVPECQICRTHNEDSRAALETLGNTADWRIVKCHKLDDHARDIFRAGNARAIYSYRDVFDAIASFLVMFRFSFDDCLQVMEESLDVYDFHRETGYFLALDYESIVNSPRQTVDKIARFLNLQVASSAIAAIDEQHSLTTIKELSGKLATSLGEDRLVKNSVSTYDPETQWHVRHVRNGGIGYGRRYLLPHQIEQVEDWIRNRKGPSKDLLPVAMATA